MVMFELPTATTECMKPLVSIVQTSRTPVRLVSRYSRSWLSTATALAYPMVAVVRDVHDTSAVDGDRGRACQLSARGSLVIAAIASAGVNLLGALGAGDRPDDR